MFSFLFPDKGEVIALRKRCERLERQLFREIDSNRYREDQLKDALMKAMGTPIYSLRRTNLESIENVENAQETSLVDERWVTDIYNAFARDRELAGAPYTAEETIAAKAAIRANPDLYRDL
jgi:hypothetical protein